MSYSISKPWMIPASARTKSRGFSSGELLGGENDVAGSHELYAVASRAVAVAPYGSTDDIGDRGDHDPDGFTREQRRSGRGRLLQARTGDQPAALASAGGCRRALSGPRAVHARARSGARDVDR